MFDHVTLHAADRAASERFLATVLPAIGVGDPERSGLSVAAATDGGAITRHAHLGLVAPSHDAVEAFWRAGVDAGYRSDGEPGPRPQYVDDYYGAFLLDPDGNSVEAMTYTGARADGGIVDHLWLRVADVAAARAFYDGLAPRAGYRFVGGEDGRATFSAGEARGSFSVVPASDDWPATRHLGIAFAAPGAPRERLLDPDGNVVELRTVAG